MHTRNADAPLVAPDWPMPRWFSWIWLLIIGFAWWTSAAESGEATQAGRWAAVAAMLTHFVAAGIETGFYVLAWSSVGRRLHFAWFFTWVMTLSLLDLAAESIRGIALRHPATAPWLAPLAGPGLLTDWGAPAALGFVVGSFGLLSMARLGLTAWLQARDVGVAFRATLAFVTTTWLTTRVVIWWAIDLARGMSPLP